MKFNELLGKATNEIPFYRQPIFQIIIIGLVASSNSAIRLLTGVFFWRLTTSSARKPGKRFRIAQLISIMPPK